MEIHAARRDQRDLRNEEDDPKRERSAMDVHEQVRQWSSKQAGQKVSAGKADQDGNQRDRRRRRGCRSAGTSAGAPWRWPCVLQRKSRKDRLSSSPGSRISMSRGGIATELCTAAIIAQFVRGPCRRCAERVVDAGDGA